MPEYLFLMHNDAPETTEALWPAYLQKLRASGGFEGGSAIGGGSCFRKSGATPEITAHLSGYIRIVAGNLDAARNLLPGNPVFEAGGTVEIRELPRSD